MAAIQCARCGDENGPFVRTPKGPLCENCLEELDGNACRVPMKGGHSALVDAADLQMVSEYKWRPLRGHNGKTYAYTVAGKSVLYMHRLIVATPVGFETDHVNGDGLDNRRLNLRAATASQNRANMWKPRRPDGAPHSSSYKGVSWDKSRGKWQSKINFDGSTKSLGRYSSEAEAARAYDVAAAAQWGSFARLNFPPSGRVAT